MSKIDQKEYLKRYLCSDDKLMKKKKKKDKDKKEKVVKKTVKIIDDNESAYTHNDEIDEGELYATNEEAPQIVGVVDERAPQVILKQEYQQSGKWKGLGSTAQPEDVKQKKVPNKEPSSKNVDKRRYSSDLSPPRPSKKEGDREIRRRSSSDLSPPRPAKKNHESRRRNSSDASPPRPARKERENRRRSSSDLSPPRPGKNDRGNRRKNSSDASPPRLAKKIPENRRRNSSDLSPPRPVRKEREIRRRSSSDQSPPRPSKRDHELPMKIKRERSLSPPDSYHKKRRDSSDQSPPRKREIKKEKRSRSGDRDRGRRRETDIKSERASRWSPDGKSSEDNRMKKTLDGKASGLQNAKSLKVENEKYRERQKKIFDKMTADVSGKDADVVIRDRRGRNKEFEYDLEKERKKMEAEEARKKVYEKWGKGLKQVEAAEERRREYEHEASKPLARSENDEDLQDYLKNQERLDDPMLMYMRKKRNDEKRSKGALEKPIYQGEFPENRFNIRPGYRWDGVDRSNGYEKKYFTMINSKKSLEEEAYKYSVEDM